MCITRLKRNTSINNFKNVSIMSPDMRVFFIKQYTISTTDFQGIFLAKSVIYHNQYPADTRVAPLIIIYDVLNHHTYLSLFIYIKRFKKESVIS